MSIPILMYHHILKDSGFVASSVAEFRSQMAYLAREGYKTLSMSEFIAYKNGKSIPPKKSVLITFDDGWKDNFIYAYPILREFGLRATLFLVSGWIEKASEKKGKFLELTHSEYKAVTPSRPWDVFLNLNEIERMSDCFDFHSHTHTHFDNYFGILEAYEDFARCKEFMQKNFDFDDKILCWPRGKFDENLLNTAKSLGYEAFFTTMRGINRADNNLNFIKRIAAKKDENWLKKTLFIYRNDILGEIYSRIKPT